MRHITIFEKNAALLGNIRYRELRMLPPHILWHLNSNFRNEKLTRVGSKFVINSFIPPFPSAAFEQFIKNSVAVYHKDIFPYSTYIAITNKCRFNCWHCSRAHRKGRELTKEEWIDVVDRLQDAGVSVIGFTGGEPLLSDCLEDVIRSVDERSTTILFTSGDGLTDEKAKSLRRAGLYYIAVSLDHYDKEVHNRLRGSDRAFDIAVDAIKVAKENGFYVATQLTVRKDLLSRSEMDRYVDFVADVGAQEIRIIEPMPTGLLIKEGQDTFLDERGHDFLKRYHVKMNRDRKKPKIASFTYLEGKEHFGCGAGIQHMYIDAFGNVCPCDFTPLSLGNISEDGFDTVYQRLRRQFNRPRNKCFLLENIDRIRPHFNEKLPLNYEITKKICSSCPKGELPAYYRKLGWDEKGGVIWKKDYN